MVVKLRWFLCPLFIIVGIGGVYFSCILIFNTPLPLVIALGTLSLCVSLYILLIGAIAIPDKTFD